MAISQYATVDFLKIKTSELLSNMETMFVGFVTSVDGVNMKYSVQPTMKATDVSGEIMDRAILFECPMMTMKCMNFYIRAPYQVGDMVYVGVSKEAIDEAIISSSSRKNRLEGLQNFRMIDGIILGGILSDEEPKLSSSNTEDLILENRSNGDKIVMTKSGGLELYTSIHVKIDSPTTHITGILNVDGNINGKSNLTIDKNITGKGNLDITGNATVTGNIVGKAGLSVAGGGTVTGSLKGGTIETSKGTTLDGHTHQYNPGSGGPTPSAPGQG